MGHAGAIISAFGESAAEKVEILQECGVTVDTKVVVMIGEIGKVLCYNISNTDLSRVFYTTPPNHA